MKNIILLLALHFIAVSFSQDNKKNIIQQFRAEKSKREIDSFRKLNFLDKNYKFLNNNFSIKVDSTIFHQAIKEFKYHPNKIKNYRDSLSVVLTYELKSFHGSRIALSRILFKWKKISYYIWENEESAKKIGRKFGFKHPYRFYKFLIDDKIQSQQKDKLLKKIKQKLELKTSHSVSIRPNKSFLKIAFKENPKRIEDMKLYIKTKSNHKHKR